MSKWTDSNLYDCYSYTKSKYVDDRVKGEWCNYHTDEKEDDTAREEEKSFIILYSIVFLNMSKESDYKILMIDSCWLKKENECMR